MTPEGRVGAVGQAREAGEAAGVRQVERTRVQRPGSGTETTSRENQLSMLRAQDRSMSGKCGEM